jgi:mono/diheme cytochrome c family protein
MPKRRRRAFPVLAWTVAWLAAATPVALGAAEGVDKARMDLGRQVFTKIAVPQCGICHALQDAGTKGEIGAKLEELQPDMDKVLQAVRQGSGVMPRYEDKLTKEQIEAVAYYVSRAVKLAK